MYSGGPLQKEINEVHRKRYSHAVRHLEKKNSSRGLEMNTEGLKYLVMQNIMCSHLFKILSYPILLAPQILSSTFLVIVLLLTELTNGILVLAFKL